MKTLSMYSLIIKESKKKNPYIFGWVAVAKYYLLRPLVFTKTSQTFMDRNDKPTHENGFFFQSSGLWKVVEYF